MPPKRRSSHLGGGQQATSLCALSLSLVAVLLTLASSLRGPCPWRLSGSCHPILSDAAAAEDRLPGGGGAWRGGPPPGGAQPQDAGPSPHGRTLSFEVCNGFANQRLALIYGLVIAKQLGRAAELPALLLDGTQTSARDRLAADAPAGAAAFEEFYDAHVLRAAVAPFGVTLLTADEAAARPPARSRAAAALASVRPVDDIAWHFSRHRAVEHLALDCPLFRLSPSMMMAEHEFVLAVLAGLRPAPAVQPHVTQALGRLAGRPFNFVHLRMERDWQAHCERWTALTAVDGVVRDNCFNNTLTVHRAMASMGFDPGTPVYVAAHWDGADPALAADVLAAMAAAGYTAVQGRPGEALPRELRALVEFEVALRAERFLGNSVSTFSALAILQRRGAGRWAGHYNGGDIPLVQVLPLFPTPWVFTFNSWSQGYEPMLKAAVNSALRQGFIAPHCIFAGDGGAPIARWMEARGVAVIRHDPAWRDALVARARGRAAANLRESHLFASERSIVGTWQRIDMPIVPVLDQYTHVLFTDTDVLFRRPFSFHEVPRPLPRAVGMGPEMVDAFPYNAGVMVANLPRLRESYGDFLAFILSNQHGLTFPGYGPGDQGAYNAFYEAEVRAWRLPDKFNAKPYHAAVPARVSDVAIVHFHGPKPMDYLTYAATGECPRFGAGMRARACLYTHEWVRRLEGDDAKEPHALWLSGCAAPKALVKI
ncbi:hypothetical protein Rsub_11478 [Raphidocelis subcapitata]|uniref:Uncharacterized protein n=1 Tax=Raphidocelis subcapitata TaxID=307507 RepID=A0A2V0PGA1_9CHLO|nr:hypothetical protein Rsub_11478 [Raphidocelis subcapitata]|eukprot:GBF98874.1 hypothetical protein Rsub_11478 [Raphidocelis subcapitata]